MTNPTHDPTVLLGDLHWVQDLAGALVRDPNLADDLAQETWLRALQRPSPGPGEARSRAWLGTVLRNLLRERHRRRARRSDRERSAAPDELVPSTDSLVERVELQRQIAREVLRLEEPTRTTLLLRYIEGLQPAAIAEQLGIPGATVRSHLRRGLLVLRERLDRAHGGDRRAWALVALPGARPLVVSSAPAVIAPAVLAKIALVLIACTIGGVWLMDRNDSREGDLDPLTQATPASGSTQLAAVSSPPALAPGRRPVRGAVTAPSSASVRGRVVDEDGRPVVGQTIFIGSPEDPFPQDCELPAPAWGNDHGRELITDDQGGFEASLRPEVARVTVGCAPSVRYRATRRQDSPGLLKSVSIPALDVVFHLQSNAVSTLEVQAFDAQTSKFLEAFTLTVRGPSYGFGGRLQSASTKVFEVPLIDGTPETITLTLLQPEFTPQLVREIRVHPGEFHRVVFGLQSDHLIRGRVLDAGGRPLREATVFFGAMSAVRSNEPFEAFQPDRVLGVLTDEQGLFELAGSGLHVSAWHPLHAAATVELEDAAEVRLAPRGAVRGQGLPEGPVLLDEEVVGAVQAGHLLIPSLDPGEHHLLTFADHSRVGVRVLPGGTTTLDVTAQIPAVDLELHSAGTLYSKPLQGILIGTGGVFSVLDLESSTGRLHLSDVIPGSYYALFFGGPQGPVEIGGPLATLDLGSGKLIVHARAGAKLGLAPEGANSLIVSLSRRLAVRADAEGRAVFEPLTPGTWLVTDLTANRTERVEFKGRSQELDLR